MKGLLSWRRTAVLAAAAFAVQVAPAAAQAEITPGASGVTASANDGNLPGNTVDNNLGTRWSADGIGQWLQFDLGSVRSVGSVRVAVHQGNSRRNRFDLQVATTAGDWTTVFSGESSGTTTAEQTYDIADVDARWVRYVGRGSSAAGKETMNSVSEVSIIAAAGAPTPTATPSPSPTPTPGGSPVTNGWTQVSWTYTMHKPYNQPLENRFSYSNGVWTTWLFPNDPPFQPPPKTGGPRTELRWNNNYTSGQKMWDGDMFVLAPTQSTVMQLFGGTEHNTSSQIRSYSDGTLRRYTSGNIHTNAFGRWVNIKVAHNVSTHTVRIYAGDTLMRTDPDRGPPSNVGFYYFKNGLYGCSQGRCEARFRNLKQWNR